MKQILYASFPHPSMAEKACGALLDHGVNAKDISLVASEAWVKSKSAVPAPAGDPVSQAKGGVSTTTPSDVAAGAAVGAEVGLGLGALAVIASLFIPGFGFVTGGGALATAIASAVGTTAAGALAGGVTGMLKDQGVPAEAAEQHASTVGTGGAIVAINLPSGEMEQQNIRQILLKYQAGYMSVHSPMR